MIERHASRQQLVCDECGTAQRGANESLWPASEAEPTLKGGTNK